MIAVSLVPLLVSLLALASTASSLSTSPLSSSSSHALSKQDNSRVLFPFQEDGVARLVSDRRLLLADDMGLGKTVQSIVALNRLFENGEVSPMDCRVLIICPKSVVAVWVDELQKWIDDRYFCIHDNSLHVITAGKTDPLDVESSRGTIQIINYDICHKHRDVLQGGTYDVLICDEAHYLKSAKSQRSDAILGIKGKDAGIQSRYLWFLTGTPILNRSNEMYPMLWAMNKGRWKSYYAFKNKWGGSLDEVSNLGELKKLMKPLILRRKKMDVLTDLPPKLYSVVSLDGSEEATAKEEEFAFETWGVDLSARKEKESYDGSEETLGAFGEGATLKQYGIGDNMAGNRALRALASIRSYTSSLKLEPAVQLLKQYTICEKVVVFANHRKVILGLKEEFGDSCVHIIGGMDTESRAEAVHRFQHDASCRLFIGSIRAAGVGLTLTASSHVVFLELDWSPGIMTQAEDRCHRLGQHDSVQVDYFVFKGTIDEWMARQLARKSQGIRRTLAQSSDKIEKRNVYKLNFGKYRGCILDDIPLNYLNNFLAKEDVYKKNPALWNALYLSDVVDEAPLNLMQEDGNGDAAGVVFTFDFGQYDGMEWSQVPESYRDWIVETKGIWETRKGLWIALHEGGLVTEGPELSVNDDDQKLNEQPKQIVSNIGNDLASDDIVVDEAHLNLMQEDGNGDAVGVAFTFDFGQYDGMEWSQVPESYRDWIVETKGIWQKRKSLWIALHEGGLVTEEPELSVNDDDQKLNEQPKQIVSDIDKEMASDDVDYTLDFGKFNGLKWCDVNEGYRDWIVKNRDVWLKRKDLWSALYNAGIVEEKPE